MTGRSARKAFVWMAGGAAVLALAWFLLTPGPFPPGGLEGEKPGKKTTTVVPSPGPGERKKEKEAGRRKVKPPPSWAGGGGRPSFLDLLARDPFVERTAGDLGNLFRLKFVLAETGKPARGARVGWWFAEGANLNSAFSRFYNGFSGFQAAALLLERGIRERADENGECLLPRGPFSLDVAAEKDGAVGFAERVNEESRPTVFLEKPVEFLVQVVDSAGRPACGVPLLARGTGATGGSGFLWSGRTASPGGRAKVRILARRYKAYLRDRRVEVLLAWPSREPRPVKVRLDPPPRKPVRLVLGEEGRLLVELERHGKKGCPGFFASLEADGNPPGKNQGPPLFAFFEKGKALFSHVGLGLKVVVRVYPAGKNVYGLGASWKGRGPSRPGETVVVRLRPGEREKTASYSFLAVDGKGKPLGDARLVFEDLAPTNGVRIPCLVGYGLTDGKGIYHGGRGPARYSSLYRVTLLADGGGRPGEGDPYALLRVPPLPEGADRFLGRLVFEKPKLLLAGRVLDGKGRGVEGAWVHARSDNGKADPLLQEPTESFLVRSGKKGKFRVFGYSKCPIVASASRFYWKKGREEKFPPFSQGVDLHLPSPLMVRGRLFLDSPETTRAIRLRAERKGGGGWTAGRLEFGKIPGGGKELFYSFELGKAGTWTLKFLLGEEYLLHRIDGVYVPGDGAGGIIQGGPVDLRGRIRALRYRVTGKNGNPPGRTWLLAESTSGGIFRFRCLLREGKGTYVFLLPLGLAPLALGASRCRPSKVGRNSGEGEEVVLSRGILVRIESRAPGRVFQGRAFYRYRLRPAWKLEGDWKRKVYPRSVDPVVQMGPLRIARVWVPAPGPYRVEWFVTKSLASDAPAVPVRTLKPRTILVKEKGNHLFRLVLTNKDLVHTFKDVKEGDWRIPPDSPAWR